MAAASTDTGYCIWTLSNAGWSAVSHCAPGCFCGSSPESPQGRVLSRAEFEHLAASKGHIVSPADNTVELPCTRSS